MFSVERKKKTFFEFEVLKIIRRNKKKLLHSLFSVFYIFDKTLLFLIYVDDFKNKMHDFIKY